MMDLEQFCENELHTYHFQLDTGEILCCKCELPKKNIKQNVQSTI